MGCWHSDILSRRHDVFCRVFAVASQSVGSNIVYILPEAGLYQFPINFRWHFPQYYMQQARSLALGNIQWCAVNIRENPVIHFTIKPGQNMAWQKTMISNGCGCHAVDGTLMGRSWLICHDMCTTKFLPLSHDQSLQKAIWTWFTSSNLSEWALNILNFFEPKGSAALK